LGFYWATAPSQRRGDGEDHRREGKRQEGAAEAS
jgi:hypothetical protein